VKQNPKHFVQTFLLGFAIVLSGCATSPSLEEPSFEVQLLPGRSLQIVQGSSTDFQVRLNRNGFTDPITVTASELPAGVTAGATTTTGSTATLRFLAATDAVQGGSKSVSIFATAGGKTSQAVTTSLTVRGAPGALDTTFGRVTFPTSLDFRTMAALAPDGSIVLVGSNADSSAIKLLRLTAEGKPDPTFPERTFDLAPGSDSVGAMAVQKDGKIVVAVRLKSDLVGFTTLGVTRFTPQGDLDTTFSGDGLALLQPIRGGEVYALALAPDGKIIVAGERRDDGQKLNILLGRFTPDGQINFITSDSFSNFSLDNHVNAVTVAPDLSIIVAGSAREDITGEGLALARFRPNGLKDEGFSVFIPLFQNSAINALALAPDGKIIAAGRTRRTGSPSDSLVVIRLLSNGVFDKGFSGDGIVLLGGQTTRSFGLNASSLIVETSGRIVIAGTTPNTEDTDFTLNRLEENGKLDLSFGDEGLQTTDFGGTFDEVKALLRTSDGRLLLVGSSNSDLALARYWP
jgi:uncharacterized delta-60 repeat protein